MIWKTTLMLLASALAVSVAADAADAKSKQRKRIAPPVAAQQAPAFHQQPARMIEVQPGLWISRATAASPTTVMDGACRATSPTAAADHGS